MHVLAISYGKNIFDIKSADSLRQQRLSKYLTEYHMVVFTRRSDNLSAQKIGENLFLHPTNSKTKIGMVFDAIKIGKQILNANMFAKWFVTSQDPFEAGFVGFILKKFSGVSLSLNIQEHGNFFGHKYWSRESFLNPFRLYIGGFLLRRADTIRVVSQRVKDSLIKINVSKKKIQSLPVCTDISAFSNQSHENKLRNKLGEDSIIIITVGRFVAQKNLSLLIRAFSNVANIDKRYKLVIVGTGKEQNDLMSLARELGLKENILFLEWVDNVPSLFAEADIYALSSNYEGWARVLVEAMSAGLPIVTTDVGCVGEVVKNDIHGKVVPVDDEKAFSEAMKIMLASAELRNNISEKNKQDIKKVNISEDEYGQTWVNTMLVSDNH